MKRITSKRNQSPGARKPRAVDSSDLQDVQGGTEELIKLELKHIGIFN
jgi:hypothetical protein